MSFVSVEPAVLKKVAAINAPGDSATILKNLKGGFEEKEKPILKF